MILFDWGTYNGLSKLRIAAALGMKFTETPPKAFTTITAHAPYYNVVSTDRSAWRGSRPTPASEWGWWRP